ncbi:MAG: formate dehydrogenase accessory sulfurtransferase FdhD [Acidimicrobiales bacterium]
MVFEPRDGALARRDDQLAIEEPLEVRLETLEGPQVLNVTMRTPGNDVELVAGWLLSEGVIEGSSDLAQIDYCVDAALGGDQRFNVVNVRLRAIPTGSTRERITMTSSSCGVCGTASIENLRSVGIPALDSGPIFDLATVSTLPSLLKGGQRSFEATGAVHGAALVDQAGSLLAVREDIGRHNAVDKVIGWALLNQATPIGGAALVVSGRVSFEIVQKAARAGIGMVAAVSGASSLAVELADEIGMTLLGFVRGDRFTLYCEPSRIGTT